jgi:hypothetical protein
LNLEEALIAAYTSLGREIGDAIRYAADRAFPVSPVPPPQPGPLTIDHLLERTEHDMDIHRYRANFPTVPTGTDIMTQEFRVEVDGSPSTYEAGSQDLDAMATSAEFEAPENSSCRLSLVYVDNAGLESPESTQTFTVQDTIPPEAPGDFGEITHLSERTESDT